MLLLFVVNTRINAISLNQPSRHLYEDAANNVAESFPNFDDRSMDTCDDVSTREYINILFGLSGNTNIIQSTVFIKGSQKCVADNVTWFVSGRVPGPTVLQCDVTEKRKMGLRLCNLLCQCVCGDDCDFLHFQMQNPPWVNETLSLCHYKQFYYIS